MAWLDWLIGHNDRSSCVIRITEAPENERCNDGGVLGVKSSLGGTRSKQRVHA